MTLLLVAWPNPQDDLLQQRRAAREAAERVAERIEDVADEVGEENVDNPDPRREELERQLRELARQLREQGDDREATLARIGSVQEQLSRMTDPQASEQDAALTQLARATSQAATGDEEANPDGEPEEAARDLEELAEQNRRADARGGRGARRRAATGRPGRRGIAASRRLEPLAQAADALDAAARTGARRTARPPPRRSNGRPTRSAQAERDRQLQRDVCTLAVGAPGGRPPGGPRRPANRVIDRPARGIGSARGSASPVSPASREHRASRAHRASPARPAARRIGPARRFRAAGYPDSPVRPDSPGASLAASRGASREPTRWAARLQSGLGGQPGSGGGTTVRRIPGGGLRTGGFDGPTRGNQGFDTDDEGSVLSDFDRFGRPGDPDFIAGSGGNGGTDQTGSGSGVGFDNDSVVPYASVFDLFNDFAQSALDRQQVPITLKDFVRDYFSRLEPTE